MGTTWTVKLIAQASVRLEEIRQGVQAQLDGVVAQMSTWEESSDLSRFNNGKEASWHTLPAELFSVLEHALRVAEQTSGAFDPTVGALVNRWGFGPSVRQADMPSDGDIQALCPQCGWQKLQLDASRRAAMQPGGVFVDLSAIAKGFGVDQVTRYLVNFPGVESCLVEVGGELKGHGIKADGAPWWTELELPADSVATVEPIILALHDLAVATSGDYRRFFHDSDVRYSHTVDPRTGRPIANGVASVTVVHESCMHADAMSTALTVLGAEEGLDLAIRHSIAALFLVRTSEGFQEVMTPAFAAMLD